MEYPEKIYATEKVGSNGIHCLDYRNYDEDIEYIRSDLVDRSSNKGDRHYEKLIRIFRWLMGYYNFPIHQVGDGRYYWRKPLDKKLKNAGIDIHKRKAKIIKK